MNNSEKTQELKFLQNHHGLTLSTISADQQPAAAYVFYAVNDQLELFLLTDKSTQKYANIQKNQSVAFAVTDEEKFTTLQGQGKISEILNSSENIEAFNAVMEVIAKKVKSWPPPAGQLQQAGIAILKITPTWLRLRDYSNSKDFLSDCIE
jgi:nitroimidazol reductase NimA-like FMN-containing flavoprotein (pyridoxamine 5'-phosphate oxidase superfamily)